MLKKECKDTWRILLESSLLLMAIPVVWIVSQLFGLEAPIEDLIAFVCMITVFAFSGYSGLTLFRFEKQDRALEYVLTLPIGRLRMFFNKLLPRFILLLFLAALLVLFFHVSFESTILPLFLLQIGAVFLSLAIDSYYVGVIALFLLMFLTELGNIMVKRFLYFMVGGNFQLAHLFVKFYPHLLLIFIPLGISFFLALKRLDLKPYRYSLKPYLYIALPVLMTQMVLYIVFYDSFQFYY